MVGILEDQMMCAGFFLLVLILLINSVLLQEKMGLLYKQMYNRNWMGGRR